MHTQNYFFNYSESKLNFNINVLHLQQNCFCHVEIIYASHKNIMNYII